MWLFGTCSSIMTPRYVKLKMFGMSTQMSFSDFSQPPPTTWLNYPPPAAFPPSKSWRWIYVLLRVLGWTAELLTWCQAPQQRSDASIHLCILHTHIQCTLHAHRCMFQLVLAKKVQSCINEHTLSKVHTCMPWIQIYVHILPNAQQAAERAETHSGAHVNHKNYMHFFFIPLSTWWHLYLSNWSPI